MYTKFYFFNNFASASTINFFAVIFKTALCFSLDKSRYFNTSSRGNLSIKRSWIEVQCQWISRFKTWAFLAHNLFGLPLDIFDNSIEFQFLSFHSLAQNGARFFYYWNRNISYVFSRFSSAKSKTKINCK